MATKNNIRRSHKSCITQGRKNHKIGMKGNEMKIQG